MKKSAVVISILVLIVVCSAAAIYILWTNTIRPSLVVPSLNTSSAISAEEPTALGSLILDQLPNLHPTETPEPSPQAIPIQKTLTSEYHVFQTFNNCGPAALSMALRYYGINKSQQELGSYLRPYQNSAGNNDDKSVTLEELAHYAEKELNLVAFRRPNGNTALVEKLIAAEVPVITRTLLTDHEDIGHFRVIKGYNQLTNTFIQDDSLQGKNLEYSYDDFDTLWQPFNYEYLVLVPQEKVALITTLLGDDADEQRAWENAVTAAQSQLQSNPNDLYAQLNLSTALYMTGEYQNSIIAFEKVESQLPQRTLWYQIEPIEAYFYAGDYDRVLSLTSSILNNQNRAFTELYILRGKVYLAQGNRDMARNEFEKAVQYNTQNEEARTLLNTL